MWGSVLKAARAAIMLACHTAIAALIVTFIWGLSEYVHWLWRPKEALLYGMFPIQYLFDTMDVGVIGLFVWYGLREAARVFREE